MFDRDDFDKALDDAGASTDAGEEKAPHPVLRGGAGRSAREQRLDAIDAYDDGFDFAVTFAADYYLNSFDIPRFVLRADVMPVPFTQCDPVHASMLAPAKRGDAKARHWYCFLTWAEQLLPVLAARFSDGNTVELLHDHLDYVLVGARCIFALGVRRYDYLALRQSETGLTDAFAHANAFPRNSLRGDGARRFLSRVVRAETSASAKIGAAERGCSYPQRAFRVAAPAPSTPSGRGCGRSGGGRGHGAIRA